MLAEVQLRHYRSWTRFTTVTSTKCLPTTRTVHAHMEKVVEEQAEDSQEVSACERVGRLFKHRRGFYNCIDYQPYADKHWPMSSGEVESAQKTVAHGSAQNVVGMYFPSDAAFLPPNAQQAHLISVAEGEAPPNEA